MRSFWCLLLAVLLVFVCSFAMAQSGDSEIGNSIDWLWTQLFRVIVVVVSGLVTKALVKLAQRFGMEVSEKQKDAVERFALSAIGYAEEWAKKKVNLKGIRDKSEAKFSRAVEKLCEKVPGLTKERAKDMIVSTLPKFRALAGVQATKLLSTLK